MHLCDHVFIAQCTQGCFNGGYCGAPETCVCNDGWGSIDCTEGLLSFELCSSVLYANTGILMQLLFV